MAYSNFKAVLGDHQVYMHPGVKALYGGRGEGAEFLYAFGRGGLVEMSSVVVWDGPQPVAASSLMWFPFDLVADAPRYQPIVHALRKVRSHTAFLRLCGLGGLHTGEPQIVISSELDPAARDAAFTAMLEVAEAEGNRRKAHFHFLMDMNPPDVEWAGPVLKERGYFPMEGTPMTWQHVPYASIDEYVASRSRKLRYQMRKQFAKVREEVEVVETSVIDDALDAELEELARIQQANARHKLGGAELMPPGFHKRLADLREVCVLLFKLKGRTVGFSYTFDDKNAFYGKALGLSWPEAIDYFLIHYNIFKGVETAIKHGKEWLIIGQGGYPTKLLFGAKLVRRTSFLKGRGIAGPLLPLFADRLDSFNPARQWQEIMVPENYFDFDPTAPQPPVNRIWTPKA